MEPDTKKFEVMTSAPEPRSSDEAMELCKNLLLFTLARNDSFDRAQQLWTSRGLPRHLFQQAVWDVLAWQSSDDDL